MAAPVAPSLGSVSRALTPICARAGYQHHASIVVSHLHIAPSPLRICVGFDEDQISGHQLLDRSHIEWGSSGFYGGQGSALCQVDNEPARYSPDCLQAGIAYWSVWEEHYAGKWTVSNFGIDATTIRDGDSEGFRYADGNSQAPPDSPGGTCPAPAPRPSVVPSAAAPRSTATPSITGGSGPTTTQRSPAAAAQSTPPGEPAAASPSPSGGSAEASPGSSRRANAATSPRRPAGASRNAAAVIAGSGGQLAAVSAAAFLVLLLGLRVVSRKTRR